MTRASYAASSETPEAAMLLTHCCLPDRLALTTLVEGSLDFFATCRVRYVCEYWEELYEEIKHPVHPLQGRLGPLIGTTLLLLVLTGLLAGTIA